MPILPRVNSLWRNLFDRENVDRELKEEIRAHLDLLTETKINEGLAPEEARRAALVELGGFEQVTESVRAVRQGRLLEDLWQDARYAVRSLRKHPGFTTVAIFTLALGISANTTIFSVINAVLLRPLPYHDADRLVTLIETIAERPIGVSYPNVVDWRNQNTVFENVAAVRHRESFNLTGAGDSERLQGRLVSATFLSTLGVKPILGRDFAAEDDRQGAAPVVLLSHALWQRRFAGDEKIVGQQLMLNRESFTVIGVTPAEFAYRLEADVMVPIGLSTERFSARGRDPGVEAIARLKPGVSAETANAELNTIAARLEQQYPESNNARRIRIDSLREQMVGNIRPILLTLLGAVGLVLLIACANVANLLLARAARRQKEIAIRNALGAGRSRILRQLFTESVMLALAAGMIGLLLAVVGTSLLSANLPDGIPRVGEIGIDISVLMFTLSASLLTGLLFGLAPALQTSNPALTETLKEGERNSSPGQNRTGKVLVVAEVALTLVLLIGAGLLVKSFWRLMGVNPGFNPENLLALQISVNAGQDEGTRVASFLDQLQQRVNQLPGVQSVAFSNGLPFESANQPAFVIEGQAPPEPGREPNGILYITSNEYLETLGITLLRGRAFSAHDTPSTTPVVLIDEVFARQYFPNEDPLGRRLKQGGTNAESREIVGIVRHVEHSSLEGLSASRGEVYYSFGQIPVDRLPRFVRRVNLLVRTTVEPLSLTQSVREQIAALDKDQPVFNVRTMEQALAQSVAARRFSTILLSVFAALALVLAAVGIYGVISYSVAQRTREVGIRMALGAQTTDVLKLVVRDGLKLVVIGVAIGLAGAFMLTRLMSTLLFGVTPTDIVTYATVALALIGVALAACYIPARRAAKVDPLVALRFE
ncbi:MAG TPA: ABC transporter permease [Pyrinomonadaceae bacterium]|nr:ABC transporter permease [Pyrinomonadaceae bacterium]